MSLALVTGATGILGKPLVRHLVAEGWQVRALARSAAARETVLALGAEPAAGDVLDTAALRAAAEGCDTVFHVAGLNAYCQRDPSALFRVNVTGSLLTLRAVSGAAAAAFGRTPLLCPETARNLRHGAVYYAGRSERDLGLQYSSSRETLGRLLDWYRAEGLVG